jgi:hypothetical protein
MAGKPSFLRDPDQAAELAALLQDHADALESANDSVGSSRAERARESQTIARYRRWAGELVAEPEDAPAEARPLHIRPAREQHGEATG